MEIGHHVTAANQWAIDVGMAARLDSTSAATSRCATSQPPAPYLHHGSFL